MPKTRVLGISYENVTLEEAVEDVMSLAANRRLGQAAYVVTPNPEISEACIKDERLAKAIAEANYIVPDGIGVIIASKIIGSPLKERVGGFDLATALLPQIAEQGLRLYLLGAKPGVAEKAAENIRKRFPKIRITGTQDGYFQSEKLVVDAISNAGADIVFVALGSPKQEYFMAKYRDILPANLLMGIGGSLDVFAGVAKRAPNIFIWLNLEWFYRLLCQPWRFARMLKLPKYLLRALSDRFIKQSRRKKDI